MNLVERHRIKPNSPHFAEIDNLAFLAKNLYNRANFIIRQEFCTTSEEKKAGLRKSARWIRYGELTKMLRLEEAYCALPRKVSQQILRQLDKNWKSFFAVNRDWARNKGKYLGRPKLPGYLDGKTGRFLVTYSDQAISKRELRKGYIQPSRTKFKIRTKQVEVVQARIVPKLGEYVFEVVYKKPIVDMGLNKENVGAIDMGINNLAAVTSNTKAKPQLINGRRLKSQNQYFNKKLAKMKSELPKGMRTSKKIRNFINKNNRKTNDEMHRASRYIISWCIVNDIGTLVIGKNKNWKQKVNIGKRNNQNFVQIPHARLIDMITYKAKLVGIEIILQEESYTSRCSFIDNEPIKKHAKYAGSRIKRGLFKTKSGQLINADCNGSGNILRKAVPDAFADGIEGVVVSPVLKTCGFREKVDAQALANENV